MSSLQRIKRKSAHDRRKEEERDDSGDEMLDEDEDESTSSKPSRSGGQQTLLKFATAKASSASASASSQASKPTAPRGKLSKKDALLGALDDDDDSDDEEDVKPTSQGKKQGPLTGTKRPMPAAAAVSAPLPTAASAAAASAKPSAAASNDSQSEQDRKRARLTAPMPSAAAPTVARGPAVVFPVPASFPAAKIRNYSIPTDIKDIQSTSNCITKTERVQRKNPRTRQQEEVDVTTVAFFLLDVYETHKGELILIGKVPVKTPSNHSTFESAAVKLGNLTKTVYIYTKDFPAATPATPTQDATPAAAAQNGDAKKPPLKIKSDVLEAVQALVKKNGIELNQKEGYSGVQIRAVAKNYVFEEPSVPHGMDTAFVEVTYPARSPSGNLYPEFKLDASNNRNFVHIFGTTTSLQETLLLKQKIMGPCWLSVEINPEKKKLGVSHCLHEFESSGYEAIKCAPALEKELGIPNGVVCSVKVKTILDEKSKANEIVMISCIVHDKYCIDGQTKEMESNMKRFTLYRHVDKEAMPISPQQSTADKSQPMRFKTEKELLDHFCNLLQLIDPDFIVGHNFIQFDLDVLLHRMKHFNVADYSKLGRIKRSLKNFPKLQNNAMGGMGESTYEEKLVMCGRLVCDTYVSAREYLRESSYSLENLAQTQLKMEKVEIDHDLHALRPYYQNYPTLQILAAHCENDAYLATKLMDNLSLLPLTKQLTNIAGNLWSRTLTGNRSERIEYLLLHEFTDKNYIVPDKPQFKGKGQAGGGGRRKAAYEGGMVFEPKKGLYDKYVLLLDFNSLYPSIIRQFGICFVTVQRNKAAAAAEAAAAARGGKGVSQADEESDDEGDETEAADTTNPSKDGSDAVKVVEEADPLYEKRVLPEVLEKLISARSDVKRQLKAPGLTDFKKWQLDNQQKALKLTANSTYGCLGFKFSRFYCRPMASLITSNGRNLLQSTKAEIETKFNRPVVYGDTDSVMVQTTEDDFSKAVQIGESIQNEINKKYKYLHIELDGMFRRILLLRKKKYAAVKHSPDPKDPRHKYLETLETKGLDQVRRDWCDLSKDASQFCLDQILKSQSSEEEVVNQIHNYMRELGQAVRDDKIEMDKFVLSKALTKLPEDYSDAKMHPHVQVAIRLRDRKKQAIRTGMRIPYVICVAQSDQDQPAKKLSLGERAYHPDEVKESNGQLKVDWEWYLSQQVMPPALRLCEHMNGTDGAMLAEFLGLDQRKYGKLISGLGDDDADGSLASQYKFLSSSIEDDSDKFKDCIITPYVCHVCGKSFNFSQSIAEKLRKTVEKRQNGDSTALPQLLPSCEHCGLEVPVARVANHISLNIRQRQQEFYAGWMKAPMSTGGDHELSRSRLVALSPPGYAIVNGQVSNIRQEVTPYDLHMNLQFFASLLDWELGKNRAVGQLNREKLTNRSAAEKNNALIVFTNAITEEIEARRDQEPLEQAKQVVERFLKRNARGYVDCTQLFSLTTK